MHTTHILTILARQIPLIWWGESEHLGLPYPIMETFYHVLRGLSLPRRDISMSTYQPLIGIEIFLSMFVKEEEEEEI